MGIIKRYLIFAGDNTSNGWDSYKHSYDKIEDCWKYCRFIKHDNISWIHIVDMSRMEIIDRFKVKDSMLISDREVQDLDFF